MVQVSSFSSSESLEHLFKLKTCLLGGFENFKNEFQQKMSADILPIENIKRNMGVNISKLRLTHDSGAFEIYLWNIECQSKWAFLRTSYYLGAESIVVLLSEIKFEQIFQYFNEIKLRMPVITIIFCVILENCTYEDLANAYLKDKRFKSLIEANQIKLEKVTEPLDIFNQISSSFLKKFKTRELVDNFFIDFISKNDLLKTDSITDHCSDYIEPEASLLKFNPHYRINTELLYQYLNELGVSSSVSDSNWIKIQNEDFGTFSIFLKNGRVYYAPKKCGSCKKNKKCLKYKKAPHFICIEAKSLGWSNIEGLNQEELLIISKIFALKSGRLPDAVIKQIHKIDRCGNDN